MPDGPGLIRIVAETNGTTPAGLPVTYQLAKDPGRGYVVAREVRDGGRSDRRHTAGLSLRAAVDLIRALKAADRGEA